MILWNAQTITENNHPGPNPLQGHSYIPQGFQKKVTGESAKNRVALVSTLFQTKILTSVQLGCEKWRNDDVMCLAEV